MFLLSILQARYLPLSLSCVLLYLFYRIIFFSVPFLCIFLILPLSCSPSLAWFFVYFIRQVFTYFTGQFSISVPLVRVTLSSLQNNSLSLSFLSLLFCLLYVIIFISQSVSLSCIFPFILPDNFLSFPIFCMTFCLFFRITFLILF